MNTTVESWATRHRPRNFGEVVGQTRAVTILQGSIARKSVPSALMLCGPTGTGKTTLARIYARAINCDTQDNCGTCASCISSVHPDIEELNAASANGVDDMRALIARSRYRPVHRVRVFILDEAQKLTPQAQQAFLKPLEEPPPNTLYILCTTDPQNFAKAVMNRALQIPVVLPDSMSIARRLHRIAKREKASFQKELYIAIGESCGGQVRDAINTLENCANIQAGAPDTTHEDLLSTVASVGDSVVAATAQDILIGIYTNQPDITAAAVLAVTEATQTLNSCIWCNEYAVAQLLGKSSPHVWPSPTNRDFAAAVRKRAPKTSLQDLLRAQRILLQTRNALHISSTKEVTVLLALLTQGQA